VTGTLAQEPLHGGWPQKRHISGDNEHEVSGCHVWQGVNPGQDVAQLVPVIVDKAHCRRKWQAVIGGQADEADRTHLGCVQEGLYCPGRHGTSRYWDQRPGGDAVGLCQRVHLAWRVARENNRAGSHLVCVHVLSP